MLPCSLRYIDGEAYLYYDITSRQNIAQLFEKKPITRQWIMDFLWSMRRVRQEMSRFLLEESNIVWFPQHVYQDLEKKEFYFIYVPYCTENTGFDELMEYLVNMWIIRMKAWWNMSIKPTSNMNRQERSICRPKFLRMQSA